MLDLDRRRRAELAVLLSHLEQQCVFALTAAADISASLKVIQGGQQLAESADFDGAMEALRRNEVATHRIWYSLHSLLSAAANISKLFWPIKPRGSVERRRRWTLIRERRAALRNALSVAEASPLHSRVFRDHLEHFDERLDAWLDEGHLGYIDSNMGPLDVMFPELPRHLVLRNFDPAAGVLSFRGAELQLFPMVSEIRRIRDALPAVLGRQARRQRPASAAPPPPATE